MLSSKCRIIEAVSAQIQATEYDNRKDNDRMKNFFRKFSDSLDAYIETKQFRWFRRLIIALGFTVTGCVCFLAGFFLNRSDNMIYKSNINAMTRVIEADPALAASGAEQLAENEMPEAVEETTVTTVITTTQAPKETLSRELLDSYIYEDLKFQPYAYRYSNTAAFHNRTTIEDFGVPLTKKSFTISYEGVITAGFDAEDIIVENDDDNYIIRITFPEAYIISHEIDEDSFELENVQDNFFNPITDYDLTSTCEGQNYRMEQQAIAGGLYGSLYRMAENSITEYLNRDSIIGAKYRIEFIRPEEPYVMM